MHTRRPHTRSLALGLAASLMLASTPAMAGGLFDQLNTLLGGDPNAPSPAMQGTNNATGLSNSEVISGLKDALRVGSENVVKQLGKTDGFNADPKIHIPLPPELRRVKMALETVGMGSMMDDLELRMNRAAEAATPKAKRIFGDAIRAMTINDAQQILKGPDDAATQYFKGKMSKPLAGEMRPIIQQALKQAGAVQAYDAVMGEYANLPFVPDVKANLTNHVVDLGLSGIFHYMAQEEAAIRKDPVKRTTQILQKVFGAK